MSDAVPDITGASFKSFLDPVLAPGAAAVAFPATLRGVGVRAGNDRAIFYQPEGGGVNVANDAGVWGVDSAGALRLLFREGDPVGGGVVKTFTVLNVARGSTGVTRSFNHAALVAWRANFAGGSSAMVVTSVP